MKPACAMLALVCLAAPTARADAVVTACQSDTQAGAGVNLQQALAAGGTIFFTCPANSVIRVTAGRVVSQSTLIDGGGNVTLDAQGRHGTMLTSTAGNLVLRRITIRHAELALGGIGRLRGSVLSARDRGELDRVTIESSDGPIEARGKLLVTDCVFRGNRSWAINAGQVTIQRSNFIGNDSGVLFDGGLIEDSSFVQNSGTAARLGAGQFDTLMRHNVFTANGRALELSQRSAFGAATTARLRANRFEGHTNGTVVFFDNAQDARERRMPQATVDSLERLPPARFAFAYDRFVGNSGPNGAAIDVDLRKSGGMSLTGGLFVGNTAGVNGGAILLRGGNLAIDHSLFRNNRAASAGAAIHAAPGNGARLSLANSLVVENAGPGAAIEAEGATLANLTIAANEGAGLALHGGASVANSILSQNRGGNCRGAAPTLSGGNLQFGAADCAGVTTGDPFLDTLYVPELGSPALRLGDAAVCAAAPVSGSDLMFQGRGTTACALGAFEHPPLRRLPRWREVPIVPQGEIR